MKSYPLSLIRAERFLHPHTEHGTIPEPLCGIAVWGWAEVSRQNEGPGDWRVYVVVFHPSCSRNLHIAGSKQVLAELNYYVLISRFSRNYFWKSYY